LGAKGRRVSGGPYVFIYGKELFVLVAVTRLFRPQGVIMNTYKNERWGNTGHLLFSF